MWVFFPSLQTRCSNNSRSTSGQLEADNFGRRHRGAVYSRGAVCTSPSASLLRGIQVDSEEEANCSINPYKNPLEGISDHSPCDPRKQGSDMFKWDGKQRHCSVFTARDSCALREGLSFPFFLCVFNLHILWLDSCESPRLRTHAVLKRCQPLSWK